MGNCMNANRVAAETEKDERQTQDEAIERRRRSRASSIAHEEKGEEEDGKRSGKVVRIKVVMTHEELKELLNSSRESETSSLERVLEAMKKRGKSRGFNGGWRPSLDSIPEADD